MTFFSQMLNDDIFKKRKNEKKRTNRYREKREGRMEEKERGREGRGREREGGMERSGERNEGEREAERERFLLCFGITFSFILTPTAVSEYLIICNGTWKFSELETMFATL